MSDQDPGSYRLRGESGTAFLVTIQPILPLSLPIFPFFQFVYTATAEGSRLAVRLIDEQPGCFL